MAIRIFNSIAETHPNLPIREYGKLYNAVIEALYNTYSVPSE